MPVTRMAPTLFFPFFFEIPAINVSFFWQLTHHPWGLLLDDAADREVLHGGHT
jgi:hypothetical protein